MSVQKKKTRGKKPSKNIVEDEVPVTNEIKYDSHGCIIGQEKWDSVQSRCVPNVG